MNKNATITGSSRWTPIYLSIIIGICFFYHFISGMSSNLVFAVLLTFMTMAYAFSRGLEYYLNIYSFVWLAVIIIIVGNYIFRYRDGSSLSDLIMVSNCFLLVLFASTDVQDYRMVLNMIKVLAVFFALTVFLEAFTPSLYQMVSRLFPQKLQSTFFLSGGNGRGFKGLSPNVGFTAGYIVAGILAFFADKAERGHSNVKDKLLIVTLFIALLYTAKRGPTIFLIISLITVHLFSSEKNEQYRIIRRVVIALAVIAFIIVGVGLSFSSIPFLSSIGNTFNTLQSGGDVSTGRLGMYELAWQLFISNPLFGIGWEKYAIVLSIIKNMTKLQTHNVYLQILCETGIVGFLVLAVLFVIFWRLAKDEYASIMKKQDNSLSLWKPLLFFSLAYQTFFLLYCLTGNPLYDVYFVIMYGFSCAIPLAYRYTTAKGLLSNRDS